MSDDDKELLEKFSSQFNVHLPSGLPPCSLKEIYQLPHKGKGKEEEEKDNKKKKSMITNNETKLNITSILGVESTENISDVRGG